MIRPRGKGDPLELDPDAVDRMIDVNVRAPYRAAVEVARRMCDDGRIIITGSLQTIDGGFGA